MAVMHFDLFTLILLLTHHYVKYKHTTPTNIHTEIVWSSYNNNYEDTSKVILLH